MFYTLESLKFARDLLSDLEDSLKDRALQMTQDAGRDTVTEADMRRAAGEIFGSLTVETNESVASSA